MSKKRVLLGLSIIAGGVCASLPFRRETPVSIATSADALAPLPELTVAVAEPGATQSSNQAEPDQPVRLSPYLDDGSQRLQRANSLPVPAATSGEDISALPKEKPSALPMLPVSFQVKDLELSQSEPWQPARLEEGPAGPPREYRLRRLDTLEDLAERFLGSKDRAEEIFAANRNVLKDRHVLPIGAVIRIPTSGADSASGSAESDLQPIRRMP